MTVLPAVDDSGDWAIVQDGALIGESYKQVRSRITHGDKAIRPDAEVRRTAVLFDWAERMYTQLILLNNLHLDWKLTGKPETSVAIIHAHKDMAEMLNAIKRELA